MIGYRTNGDWTDVTSISRNQIVFEGRNKEYGAYVIRQRYDNSLILALLIACSVGVLCAGIPFIINLLHPSTVLVETKPPVDRYILRNYKFPARELPKTIPTPKVPHTPPPSTSKILPPKIIKTDPIIKDIPLTKPDANPQPVTPDKTGGAGPDLSPVDMPGTPPVEAKLPPPMAIVEVMPKFKDLEGYITQNVQLPAFETQEGIEGTVYLTFVVEVDGSLSGIKILRGIAGGPGYNDAAIKVLEGMPKWSPGMNNGHKVRVQMNLPIHFKTRE